MVGTIVNCIAIILGCLAGLLIKGGIPEKISDTVMKGLGLCVVYIGISGSLKDENTIITIICIAIGAVIGEVIDIDEKLNSLGNFIEKKVNKKNNSNTESNDKNKKVSIAEGFIYSSLIFCVGAMAIVGSLESGLQNNYETLFTKSILDGISSVVFTASLGVGVFFSAIAVLLYQGTITLFAGALSNILSEAVIISMTSIGSLLILGLGLNMLNATKIKVANLLPSIFIPIILGIFGVL